MTYSFRTLRFDTNSPKDEDHYYGEDLAKWLAGELHGWDASVMDEDWGWAVVATRGDLLYLFGVYDHDVSDITVDGPRWYLRVYNERDKSTPWYKKLFKHVPPTAHPEVLQEIEGLLSSQPDFTGMEKTPLT